MKRFKKIISFILIILIIFTYALSTSYAASLKIVIIQDLYYSVFVNQIYKLPNTVNATMSNKSIQKVAIVWNKKTVVTSKTGTFVFIGAVKGYSKQIHLTLRVLPSNIKAISFKGIRVVVDGKINIFDAKLIAGDWYLKPSDIKAAIGIDCAGTLNGFTSLRDAARMENVSYEHDSVLNAAYIWTNEKYQDSVSIDFDHALRLGLVPNSLKSHIDRKITAKEFRALLLTVVSKLNPSKVERFKKNVSTYNKTLLRGEGFVMAYYAAICVGADTQNNSVDGVKMTEGDFWDNSGYQMNKLFPHCADGPVKFSSGGNSWIDYRTAAFLWSFWHNSPYSGIQVFEYDASKGSMRQKDPLTVKEAVEAATRIYDSYAAPAKYLPLSDISALTYDKTVITDKLLNNSTALPKVSKDYIPSWKGFVLQDQGYVFNGTDIVTTDNDLRRIANWGFNSARIMLTYQTLFSDDVQSVNVTNLKKLDLLIAEAIKYNLHLDVLTATLPGRWTKFDSSTYKSVGSFDLFTNPDRQKEANKVWALLSERYKDIPSATLSFCPLWEAQNIDLSSGLPVPTYTDSDVANVYSQLVDTIKAHDPDRFIIFEPTPSNNADHIVKESDKTKSIIESKYSDTLLSANFCENPFVYSNMTAVVGDNIDMKNHSMFKPEYPLVIYATQYHIDNGSSLQMDGKLVAGTKIDIYLSKVNGVGNFEIMADGKILSTQSISSMNFKVGSPLSIYYPYAKSNKLISITLKSNVKNLQIKYGGNWFEWSGIDVTLPKQYAVKRWWYPSDYDTKTNGLKNKGPILKSTSTIILSPNSYSSGNKITINQDVTYTTSEIFAQSNKQTIDNWAKTMSGYTTNLQVRFENAMFGTGCSHDSAMKYYDDMLSAFQKCGFGWFSNDYQSIIYANNKYAGIKPVKYKGFTFDVDLLKLLQKYQ